MSQFYEWLPWVDGRFNEVPKGNAERKEWLKKERTRPPNEDVRASLTKWYGPETAANTVYYEAFEICEYGAQPKLRATRANLGDFLYIAGWEFDLNTYIDPPLASPRATLKELIVNRAQASVKIRALLDTSRNSIDNNKATAQQLANIPNAGAKLDYQHQLTGSQHQKMVIARTADGVVAFCGGMDIANHRLGRLGLKPNDVVSTGEMSHRPLAGLERTRAARS